MGDDVVKRILAKLERLKRKDPVAHASLVRLIHEISDHIDKLPNENAPPNRLH